MDGNWVSEAVTGTGTFAEMETEGNAAEILPVFCKPKACPHTGQKRACCGLAAPQFIQNKWELDPIPIFSSN
jgi:hypothetical protein